MALDPTQIKVKPTVMPKRAGTRPAKDLGPNFWLDPTWPYNLQNSYDNAEPFEMTVTGRYVKDTYKRGGMRGQEYDKLVGDAADAVKLIRDAAEKLGLGVSVPVTPALYETGPKKGQVREGYYVVKWQAGKRKQRKTKPNPEVAEETTPEETGPETAEQS